MWPYAVAGAMLVVALVWSLRRNAVQAAAQHPPPSPQAMSDVAPEPKIAPLTSPEVARPAPAPTQPAAVASPNLIGGAVTTAKGLAMVAKSELDRALARSETAQKQAASYRKQIADLEKQLADARGQVAALQKAKMPPPPTEQEQILQMLAPVLKTSSNDGRP
jgi:hypothetical protein